jgi:preprotein translocase subunit SecG
MRLIGMVLALGAIVWVMLQAAGGGDAETVIPESYQQSINKAQGLEQSMQDAANEKMRALEEE